MLIGGICGAQFATAAFQDVSTAMVQHVASHLATTIVLETRQNNVFQIYAYPYDTVKSNVTSLVDTAAVQ